MSTEDFSQQKTHEQNLNISISKVLKAKTSLRRERKTRDDAKKAIFCRVLETIMISFDRNAILSSKFQIDLTSYNDLFFKVIDDLLQLNFNKEQIDLINFFMYDRFTETGQILHLVDSFGIEVKLDNTQDLWNLLKTVEDDRTKRKA